jgi:uncharacterized protein YbjQ (UPF0145 family)
MESLQTLTMPIYPGRAYRPLNAVIQFETVGIATWRDWVTKIVDVIGGRAKTYDRPIISALQNAIEKVQRAATALGGDAIIDLHIAVVSVSSKGLGMSQLLVTGTAIAFIEEYSLSRAAVASASAVQNDVEPLAAARTPGVEMPYGFTLDPDVPQLGTGPGSTSLFR